MGKIHSEIEKLFVHFKTPLLCGKNAVKIVSNWQF